MTHFIVKNILTFTDYLIQLDINSEQFRPDRCPHCGLNKLWIHGSYSRKADRESPPEKTLNMIPICHYFCNGCKRTCSTFPECIPPRRWYLWHIQQAAILSVLMGKVYVSKVMQAA